MIFPFFIISILVIMDTLIMQEENQVLDLSNEKNQRLKSTTFMKSMKIILLIIGVTFCFIYWVTLHYFTNGYVQILGAMLSFEINII